jgi:hypothetical protein
MTQNSAADYGGGVLNDGTATLTNDTITLQGVSPIFKLFRAVWILRGGRALLTV